MRPIALLALLIPVYVFINPDWYGDALWYAADVERPTPVLPESFHLIWIPLGRLIWRTGIVEPHAIIILQVLSALGAVLSIYATWRLSRIFLPPPLAIPSSLSFALTHFLVAYGGSGSTYPAALGALMMAYVAVLQSKDPYREWKGTLWAVLALSFWGVSVLGMLGYLIAASLGDSFRHGVARLWHACVVAALPNVMFALIILLSYHLFVPDHSSHPFMKWVLAASSHGVGGTVTLVTVMRAALGVFTSVLYLGGLGTSLKQIIFREIGYDAVMRLVPYLVGLSLWCALMGGAALKLLIEWRLHRDFFLLLFASALPVGLFAIGWHGSDVERWSLCLPLMIIGVWKGLAGWGHRTLRAGAALIFSLLIGCNLLGLIEPTLSSGGNIDRRIARVITERAPHGALVVVTGQELGARAGHIAIYFYKLAFHSISFDVLMRGAEGWEERLSAQVDRALAAGHPIVVLSDLVGTSTPGGIGLSAREFPAPSLQDTQEYFNSRLVERSRFTIDKYTFVEFSALSASAQSYGNGYTQSSIDSSD